MGDTVELKSFERAHFADVIALGNKVHGDNYLDMEPLEAMYLKSFSQNINASLVAYIGDKLVGFRLTWAPGNWQIDQWCTPELWQQDPKQVCYFKCNTVDEAYRGKGIGGKLLAASIERCKKQGATAGLSHIWLQSPGNSALRYMTRAGGKLIKKHPDRWYESSINDGYHCVTCNGVCHCEAAEMLLTFE